MPAGADRRVRGRSAARNHGSGSATRSNQILTIAASLFVLKGFEGTTMRDIAAAVGILPGSLYHHFASKEQLLHEIMQPFIRRSVDLYREIVHRKETPAATLRALIDAGLGLSIAEPATHSLLMHQWEFLARNPDFRYVVRQWRETHDLWSGVIADGVKSGVFRADLNIRLTTELVLEQISSTVFWSRFKKEEIMPEVVRAQIDLVMHGVLRVGKHTARATR